MIPRVPDRPEYERNEHVGESVRRNCLGAHTDEQEVSSGVGHNEGRDVTGDAASGTRRDSKRVETKSLAGQDMGQHRRYKCKTYPAHPHYPPNVLDDSSGSSAHHVDVGDSRRSLEVSGQADGPTRTYGRVGAISGESGASYTLYLK